VTGVDPLMLQQPTEGYRYTYRDLKNGIIMHF
jgi:hypothetical protein